MCLSQERAGEPWYPASLTKLMTAYVVFEKLKTGQLKLDQKIPVSELAAQPAAEQARHEGRQHASASISPCSRMLVYSANDMAYVLAEAGARRHQAFRAADESRRRSASA